MNEEFTNEIEMEKRLLSALWLREGDAIPRVTEILRPEYFYRPFHRLIYEATIDLYNSGAAVDIILVEQELKRRGQLSDRFYLFSLAEMEYTTSRAETYAKEIREKARQRRLASMSKELLSEIDAGNKTTEELLSEMEKAITEVTATSGKTTESLKDAQGQSLKEMLARRANKGKLLGVTTGFIDLDAATSGLCKSNLIILAARPSMGKTALALNTAGQAAKDVPVLFFSLEMSKVELIQRLWSMESQVAATKIRNGWLTDDELEYVVNAAGRLEERQLYIDDTAGITLSEMRMRARRLKHEHGLGLIVVDYMQLIQGSKEYRGNRVQEVSEISRGLKSLSKELEVPVLALSQLSRQVEMRAEKKPQLSDLRDSGSIEQDADIVMFLYREQYYDRDIEDNTAEVIIAKNRNGSTGTVGLVFERTYLQFSNLTRRVD